MRYIALMIMLSSCAQLGQLTDKRYLVEQCIHRLASQINEEIAAYRCSLFYGYEQMEEVDNVSIQLQEI